MKRPTPPESYSPLEAEIFTVLMWRDRIVEIIEETVISQLNGPDRLFADKLASRTSSDHLFKEDYPTDLARLLLLLRPELDAIWRPDFETYDEDGSGPWPFSPPQTDEANALMAALTELTAFHESVQKLQVLCRVPRLGHVSLA